jgi:hypothetical protein
MRQEIEFFTDAPGRTVEAVMGSRRLCSQIVVTFTDGTFATLDVIASVEDFGIEATELDPFDFGTPELVELGILSEEDVQRLKDAHKQAHANRERAEYERLRKLFAGADDETQ